MLKKKLGYHGKPKILELLDEEKNITRECYADKNDIELGKIKVVVFSIHDRPSRSQTIKDTVLVTVTLALHSQGDIEDLKVI